MGEQQLSETAEAAEEATVEARELALQLQAEHAVAVEELKAHAQSASELSVQLEASLAALAEKVAGEVASMHSVVSQQLQDEFKAAEIAAAAERERSSMLEQQLAEERESVQTAKADLALSIEAWSQLRGDVAALETRAAELKKQGDEWEKLAFEHSQEALRLGEEAEATQNQMRTAGTELKSELKTLRA